MVTTGLIVVLEARPGKEDALAAFLRKAVPLVEEEAQTIAWFAIKLGASSFAIVDVFPDRSGRRAHLTGPVAAALAARAEDLLAEPLEIQHVDVLAAKLPEAERLHA
jgi:quinol monooxygenase YgiN